MAKFRRGEVYLCLYESGKNKKGEPLFKDRPMVVLSDTDKNPQIVPLIYCTGENKSLSTNYQIKVEKGTHEYFKMGLTKTTYILPTRVLHNFPVEAILERIGICPFMSEIENMHKDYLVNGDTITKKAS